MHRKTHRRCCVFATFWIRHSLCRTHLHMFFPLPLFWVLHIFFLVAWRGRSYPTQHISHRTGNSLLLLSNYEYSTSTFRLVWIKLGIDLLIKVLSSSLMENIMEKGNTSLKIINQIFWHRVVISKDEYFIHITRSKRKIINPNSYIGRCQSTYKFVGTIHVVFFKFFVSYVELAGHLSCLLQFI